MQAFNSGKLSCDLIAGSNPAPLINLERTIIVDIEITDEEKKDGWYISVCNGNAHRRGCKKTYKKISDFLPDACPNCQASFCD